MSSLFGNSTNTANTGAKPGGIFSLNTQPSGGLFGNTQQNKPGELKGFGFSTQNQNTTQGSSVFGSSTQQQNNTSSKPGLFTFGQSQQQQDANNPPQRDLSQTLRFGNSVVNAQQAAQALWEEGRGLGVYRSIPDQMEIVKDKWDAATLSSPLQAYLYAYVGDERNALHYRPGPDEDETKWEEAVTKRPGPAWVPVLVRGFGNMANKAQLQMETIAKCNMLLNEINTSLDMQLETHNQKVTARLAECKRRQTAASRRTLALAVKVQILRNKGYVMDNAEEELKSKLEKLERDVCDPALDAREQEIWARMLGIRERAKRLKAEMEKITPAALAEEPVLDEETVKQAKEVGSEFDSCVLHSTDMSQILEAYDTQLRHLHKELQLVQQEYQDWEKFSKGNDSNPLRRR